MPEDGTVTVSPGQPAIGRPVTATLSEPDTEVSGLKWQWQSSSTGVEDPNSFTDIEGADSDTYTPMAAVPDDEATEDIDERQADRRGPVPPRGGDIHRRPVTSHSCHRR